jgi:hypothetical protein
MAGSDEDRGRNRRPDADDQGWSSTGRILSGRMIQRSVDVVCALHHAQGDDECWFLGLASKSWSTVSPDLTSKSVASGFPIWASKPTGTVW